MLQSLPAIKRGVLWQQRERLWSRWKERYFVLTSDYLHCFKRRAAGEGLSQMGHFIFKVRTASRQPPGLQASASRRRSFQASAVQQLPGVRRSAIHSCSWPGPLWRGESPVEPLSGRCILPNSLVKLSFERRMNGS